MFSKGNPYQVAGPIQSDAQFVGQRDILAWLWQTLNSGERIAIVTGQPLIGKSSLLLRMEREARPEYLTVYLDVVAASQAGSESLLALVIERLHQAMLQNAAVADEEITASAPASVWKILRELGPDRQPLLLLDNLDILLASGADAGWQFVEDLAELMNLHEDVKVVCAVRTRDHLMRADHLPFFRAPWRRLDPLSRAEAMQLIKKPSEGVLDFDYDAITRIDELTGRHPYFIQLLCGEIFEHKAGGNYVTMVDIEPAMLSLGQGKVELFQDAWDKVSPEGRLLLSLLGSQRGAYEVVTQAELSTGLRSYGIQASLTEINLVLDELVKSGALHQLGSLSYRLPVELFRYWLRQRHPMEETVSAYRWQPEKRKAAGPPTGQSPASSGRAAKITLAVLVPLVILIAAIGIIVVLQREEPAPEPSPTPTHELATMAAILLSATDTATPAEFSLKPATSTPRAPSPSSTPDVPPTPTLANTDTPVPTPTASPTRPLVVARAMPAIAYMHKVGNEPWAIWLIDADGKSPSVVTDGEASDSAPIWSPEGLRLAFVSERDENKEIYAMNMDGSNAVNLTNHEADDWTPAWSPDGTEIAFSSMRNGNWDIYLMWADGADPLQLTDDPESDFAPTWSPDGKSIAFASKRDGDWDIFVMDRDGKNVRQLTDASGNDLSPAWSPDGKYIAFESARDGNTDIYRMLADGSEETNLSRMNSANDHWPTWSPDSSRLAFCSNRDGDWDIYVMSAEGGDAINLTDDDENSQGPAWRP